MNYVKTAVLLAGMTALFMGVGYTLGGQGGMLVALLIAAGTNLWAWWGSDKAVLKMHGAQPVSPGDQYGLHEMTDLLSKNAGLPTPKVYLINTDQPNAFATGRNPENAAVAVTAGLLRTLSKEEVAGVVAHELAHIQNRDTLIMTITATIAGAVSMLGRFGMMFGRGGNSQRSSPIAMILTLIVAPLAAMLIQMFVSRTREYAADKRGAEICGEPLWLASALQGISRGVQQRPMVSAENDPATAHMFIINPLSGRRADKLFSTHPSTENRVAELQKLAAQMGRSGTQAGQRPRSFGGPAAVPPRADLGSGRGRPWS